ncbi:MAG: hypothetical protein JWM53_2145 [bacterium]|nr:hypothetical protein [bacterium]
MKYSLDDYLVLALPALADGLSPPSSFDAMRAIARRLPPSGDFGFECRLGAADDAVDLLARIRSDDGSRAAYAGRNAEVAPAPELAEHPPWRRVRALCAAWASPDDPLHSALQDLWLELDRGELEAKAPVPCIFFQPVRAPERLASITERALWHVHGSAALPPAVQRCFEIARDGALVIQIGVMLSRANAPIRLVLQTDDAGARRLLAELRWPGAAEQLEHFFAHVRPLISSFAIDLDLRDTVSPKIGFECYGDAAPDARLLMEQLLARLCHLGLADRAKADALLRWPGVVDGESSPAPWPRNLLAAAQRRGWRSAFLRRVNHVKVAYAPGQPPCAKAYFGLTHRWLDGAPAHARAADIAAALR